MGNNFAGDTETEINTNTTMDNFRNSANIVLSNDSDFDPRNIPYPGSTRDQSLQTWEICVKVLVYSLIIMVSLVGNTLVVYVVLKIKRMRTTTNYYIVNLAVSDLMVTTSYMWVRIVTELTEGWILGAFFCKFNSFSQVLSFVASIVTLTLIACDRFFGIVFAMKARMTERRSTVFIIAIWMFAVGISSPLLVFREQFSRQWLDHLEIWCADTWPAVEKFDNATQLSYLTKTVYFTVISVVLFFLPVLIMSIAYSFIIWKLWSSKTPGERVESDARNPEKNKKKVKRKVIIMLVIILCVFAICWLPKQVSVLYSEHRLDITQPLPSWYSTFTFVANYLGSANSALNPIIYTAFNENFKRAFKSVFRCGRKRRGQYNQINGSLGHSTVVTHYQAHGSSLGGNFHTTIVTKI